MKVFLPFVLAIAAVVISGCDSAKSAAARAGLTGFETRCETTLAPTRIDVVIAPVVHATDRTRSWRELTAMTDDDTSDLRAVGLTTAQIGHQALVESAGIENQRDGRVCVRPSIRVELSATPMTVYISREIAVDPCRDAAALEHELKHVAVYEDVNWDGSRMMRKLLTAELRRPIVLRQPVRGAARETKEALGGNWPDPGRRCKAHRSANRDRHARGIRGVLPRAAE
jgi:hypothetical protein